MRVPLFVIALLAAALPVAAQEDVEGSKDHPLFTRMPGYYIEAYEAQDFAPFEFAANPPGKVEGRYWQIGYRIKEGGKKFGPLQIARNYTDPILKRSGKKVLEDANPNEAMTVAQFPVGGKNIWIQVEPLYGGEAYTLTVIEEAGMEQKVEFTAMDLLKTLNDKGAVALHGILFDTGKATIKPESEAALAPIGEMMKSEATLKLEIQGHTDNVGAAAANLRLSQDRAASVKAYLVEKFGVTADRLTTAGFGDTKPVTDNTTEQGRAQNRRVELVKK